MKPAYDKARRRKPKQWRATIADLQRFADADFRVRSPGPRPSGRKPHGQRRALTVAADETAIGALRPDGTRQQIKVAGVPHLYVRLEPNGTRTFHCMRDIKGKWTGRKIGDAGKVTLREATLGCQIAVLKWRVEELEAELQAARDGARRRFKVVGIPRGAADA